MRTQLRSFAKAAVICTACLTSAIVFAAETKSSAQVKKTLNNLEAWLAKGPNGPSWERYLDLPALRTALAKDGDADLAAVAAVLKQLESGSAGLELEPFSKLREATAQWSDELSIAKTPLPEAALAAEAGFRPITDADVAAAKTSLQTEVAKLDHYLAAGGANGAAWKEYLRWPAIQAQLASNTPDVDELKKVASQFAADQVGLELPVFNAVRDSLEHYTHALEAHKDEVRGLYVAQLKSLSDELKKYADDHSEELATALGARIGWLENMRQALSLVRAVRSRYSRPNLHAQLSGRLVAAGIEQAVDDVAPVTDVILGTNISGTGRTVGRLAVQLVPSEDKAMLETTLVGTTTTRTVGVNGPAAVYTDGTTQILGSKRIVIDENGLASYPAKAKATTKTKITGVGAKSRMVQKIATRKVYEAKGEAEAIGSDHAAARVRQRVEKQSADQLGQAQWQFNEKFRNPLMRRREFPSLEFSTTKDSMFVKALQANRTRLGAPNDPPNITVANDLAVQLHESMVNNLAAALLSGMTLKEEELQKKVIEWRGSLPDQLKSDEDRDPWSITFANERPVTIKFDEGGFQVTVRGQRYTSGERAFRAMNVTADYKMEMSGNGSVLKRQGELQILPPGFVPGQTRLSTQQVTLKTLLQRKFGKLFEPEIKNEGLALPGRWKQAGRLDLKQMEAKRGWLALAWIESGEPAPAEEKVAREDR